MRRIRCNKTKRHYSKTNTPKKQKASIGQIEAFVQALQQLIKG